MRIAIYLLFLILLLLPTGCRTMGIAQEQFDRSSRDYNRMVRWEEFAMANIAYVDKGIREAYERMEGYLPSDEGRAPVVEPAGALR